jgi:Ca-activated chloride channel family protein
MKICRIPRKCGAAMSVLFVAIVVLGSVGSYAQMSIPAPPPPDEPGLTFRTSIDLVTLNAAVFDGRRRLVTGLPREAFRVYQDGRPVAITEFTNRDVPISMGLVMDSSASMVDKRVKSIAGAVELMQGSNPQDEVFYVDFKDTVDVVQGFTNDFEKIERALNNVRLFGGTAVMDALKVALEQMKKARRDKKVIMLLTDGEDDSSDIELDPLLALLQRSDVTVYTIGLLSTEPTSKRRRAQKFLEGAARVTGGVAYFPQDVEHVQLLGQTIAHDIRNQYVLAYQVPPGTTRGFHRIKVEAESRQRGKLDVRTRTGYYYDPNAPVR